MKTFLLVACVALCGCQNTGLVWHGYSQPPAPYVPSYEQQPVYAPQPEPRSRDDRQYRRVDVYHHSSQQPGLLVHPWNNGY